MSIFMSILMWTLFICFGGIIGYMIRDIQQDLLYSKSKSIFDEKQRLCMKIGQKCLKWEDTR